MKKVWRKEWILWVIVFMWSLLFWEGHRILPGAKWLSEVIPVWIVILNLAIFFISMTVLMNERNLSPIGGITTLICVLFSNIFLSIGFQRFPLVSGIGVGVVLLVIFGLKIIRGIEDQNLKE